MATILVADDVRSEATLLSQVVERLGHRPVIAEDGEAALAMAEEVKPALILLDIVMPKIDGFDVCHKLKKGETTSKIPIIMVSSKDQRSDRFWAERLGADDYVTKPFDPEILTEKIKKFIS
jgi:twitching motility two-component system response regulator PilH